MLLYRLYFSILGPALRHDRKLYLRHHLVVSKRTCYIEMLSFYHPPNIRHTSIFKQQIIHSAYLLIPNYFTLVLWVIVMQTDYCANRIFINHFLHSSVRSVRLFVITLGVFDKTASYIVPVNPATTNCFAIKYLQSLLTNCSTNPSPTHRNCNHSVEIG